MNHSSRWVSFLGLFVLALVGCHSRSTTAAVEASPDAALITVIIAPTAASASANVAIDDPPAPHADDVAKAPGIEQQLLSDPVYPTLWATPADTEMLVNAVGQALVNEGPENTSTSESTFKALKKKTGAMQVFSLFVQYEARTGKLPADFVTRLDAYLATIASQPHLGLWNAKRDFSATAFAAHLDRPEYLREFIAARSAGGNYKWADQESPYRVYFARERAALERLAFITTLTPAESARLQALQGSSYSDKFVEPVELSTLLSTYSDNELRADSKYKNHAVQVTGVVGDVRQGKIGGITVTLGRGGEFETTKALCSFDDAQAASVAKLSRGQKATVRANVDGLMLEDVMLSDCELAN